MASSVYVLFWVEREPFGILTNIGLPWLLDSQVSMT